jgi:streptomycin 6-kinase
MMAAEVQLPSIESTSETCSGCGEALNLLENHLKLQAKTERAVVVTQPRSEWEAVASGEERTPEAILAALDADEEEETVSYLGWRSGAGELVRVHNGKCAAAYLKKEFSDEKPKLKLFKAGEDDYETVGRGTD